MAIGAARPRRAIEGLAQDTKLWKTFHPMKGCNTENSETHTN